MNLIQRYRPISIILLIVIACSSCQLINPSQMFRTGRDFPYADFATTPLDKDYKLAINDKFNFILTTNSGERLIDPVANVGGVSLLQQNNIQSTYCIDNDGMTKLPILGRVSLVGKTKKEVEDYFEKEYSKYYNDPFVLVTISNQRIFLFPGSLSGEAKVLALENENTTLLEAIAQAGGIAGGKAHRIKLIRGDMKNPQVFLIDLSTIEGMKRANLIVQANDVIYIESRDKVPARVLEAITPYLTLATTLLLIIKIF